MLHLRNFRAKGDSFEIEAFNPEKFPKPFILTGLIIDGEMALKNDELAIDLWLAELHVVGPVLDRVNYAVDTYFEENFPEDSEEEDTL